MHWILTDEFPPAVGGVATWASAVAAALAEHVPVTVCCRARPGVDRDDDGRPWPFTVVPVPGRSFGALGGLWTARSLWGRVRAGDTVIAVTWRLGTHLQRVLPSGVRVHVVAHGGDVADLTNPALRAVWARASSRWAVSRYLASHLREVAPDVAVLAPPLPAPAWGPDRDLDAWAFVGRMVPEKGGDRVIRLAAAEPTTRVVMIGDGPARSGWEQLAAALGCAGRVRFVGARSRLEVRALLSEAGRCLLLPRALGPVHEGLGLCLVEAAALGCRPVGARVGGVPEVCGGGWVLTDPDDVAGALVALRGPRAAPSPPVGADVRDALLG